MRTLLCVLALLLCPTFVVAQPVEKATVRVYVYEDGDNEFDSMGSGVLVTNNQIVTNYHVVIDHRPGNECVMVRFSDGTRSWATVEHTDNSWDLALLRINPHATITAMPIGPMPNVGDTLTIHGLGRDYEFKSQAGTMSVIQLAPTESDRAGWIKVSGVAARNGDSGGPITNEQGQWVGMLFGSNDDSTGKYTLGLHVDLIREVFGRRLKLTNDNYREQACPVQATR